LVLLQSNRHKVFQLVAHVTDYWVCSPLRAAILVRITKQLPDMKRYEMFRHWFANKTGPYHSSLTEWGLTWINVVQISGLLWQPGI